MSNTRIPILGCSIVVLYIFKRLFQHIDALFDGWHLGNTCIAGYYIQKSFCIVQLMDEVVILVLLRKRSLDLLVGIVQGLE